MASDPYCTLLQGDALSVLKTMPDESVDMCMTSPPYWGLRKYSTEGQIWDGKPGCVHEWGNTILREAQRGGPADTASNKQLSNAGTADQMQQKRICGEYCLKCGAWQGELGLEPTYQLYIDHLMQIFDEVKRVLKKTGVVFVNIADSYSGAACTVPAKSLIGIPERFALAMTDRLGFIRRNTVIWWKRNPMPESVKDRFTEDFEYLYMFSKQGKYFFEQQFEPANDWGTRDRSDFRNGTDDPLLKHHGFTDGNQAETGRNKRTTWDIPTESGKSDHYAAYPEKLCETPILAGCPAAICTKCGKAREKIYQRENMVIKRTDWGAAAGNRTASSGTMVSTAKHEVTGVTNCGCGASVEPGICLDPFAGTGTTGAVSKRLGRKAVLIELSPKYCQIIEKRIANIPMPMELNL